MLLDYASLLSHAPQLGLADLAERLHGSESSRVRLLSLLSVAAAASLHFAGVEVSESVSRVRVQLLDEFDIERAWKDRHQRHMDIRSPLGKQASAAVRAAAKASADAAAAAAAAATAAPHDPMHAAEEEGGQPAVRRTSTGRRVTATSGRATGSAKSSVALYHDIAGGGGLCGSLVLPQPDELDAIMTHLKILMQRECREKFVKPVRNIGPAVEPLFCSARDAAAPSSSPTQLHSPCLPW